MADVIPHISQGKALITFGQVLLTILDLIGTLYRTFGPLSTNIFMLPYCSMKKYNNA